MSGSDVCDLPAKDLQNRLAMIRAEILPRVKQTQQLPSGVAWEFDRDMRAKLEHLVALERQCCSGLEWNLEERPDSSTLRLSVEGPGAASLLSESLGTPATEAGDCGHGC